MESVDSIGSNIIMMSPGSLEIACMLLKVSATVHEY